MAAQQHCGCRRAAAGRRLDGETQVLHLGAARGDPHVHLAAEIYDLEVQTTV
jgi:hypothetical protein